MNEDGTTTAPATTDDGEQQESVTEAEVLEVMGKQPPASTEEETEESEAEEATEEAASEEESAETTETEAATEESPKAEATTEAAQEAPSFSIEVEDANGNKFTVSPDDNLEEVLAEFEPKNNGQVIQLIRELDRLTGEKQSWENQQTEAAEAEARATEIKTIQEGWDGEIAKLQGEKRLPLDAKIEDRKNAIFKFMAEENDKREQEGRPLLMSFEDALDKLELREGKDAKAQAAKEEKERNKQRGALVGGSSAPATAGTPVYKSGTASNANEAIRALGLL